MRKERRRKVKAKKHRVNIWQRKHKCAATVEDLPENPLVLFVNPLIFRAVGRDWLL
jgi:uncharacterized protein YehS (DUF1456 family)